MQPLLFERAEKVGERVVRNAPAEVFQEPEYRNYNAEEEFSTPQRALIRSTRVRRMSQFFADCASVATEESVMMEEDIKSSNKDQLQKVIK